MDNQRKNSVEKSELEKAVVHLTHHIKKLNKCEELAREVFLQPLEKLINQARQERRVVEEKLLERLRLYRQFGDTQVDDDLDSTGPTMAQVAAAYRLRTLLEILRDLQEMQMKLLGWLEYSQIADSSLLSAKIRAQLKPLIQIAQDVLNLWDPDNPVVVYKEEAEEFHGSTAQYQVAWRSQRDLETRICRFHVVIRRLLDRLQKLFQMLRNPKETWASRVATELHVLPEEVSLLKVRLPDKYLFEDDNQH